MLKIYGYFRFKTSYLKRSKVKYWNIIACRPDPSGGVATCYYGNGFKPESQVSVLCFNASAVQFLYELLECHPFLVHILSILFFVSVLFKMIFRVSQTSKKVFLNTLQGSGSVDHHIYFSVFCKYWNTYSSLAIFYFCYKRKERGQ